MLENITTDVMTKSLTITAKVTMVAVDSSNLEFTTDIDEIGQILLCPVEESVKFVNIDTTIDATELTPVIALEDNVTTKSFPVVLNTTMLSEVESPEVTTYIDEQGCCVVCPADKDSSFLTVSVDDSLNLITETMQTEDYFGYKFVNNGDGWDVYDPTHELIEEGVATLPEAKILVCTTEIARLEALTESIDTSVDTDCDITDQQLSDLTNEFTEEGVIICSTECEQDTCKAILSQHYTHVNTKITNDKFYVMYYNEQPLTEELDLASRDKLIWRMMNGDIDIVMSNDTPAPEYIHLDELDTNDYTYYYDEGTDVIVSYHTTSRTDD